MIKLAPGETKKWTMTEINHFTDAQCHYSMLITTTP